MSEEKNIEDQSTDDNQRPTGENLQPVDDPQPGIPNAKSETENMEVHHHAHHHEKRSWKSYLWEFVMLFLAVFCGFLAEYQLEHVIENQREKKYMKDMVINLQADTAMISGTIKFAKVISNGIDPLRQNLYSDSVLEKTLEIYRQEAMYMRIVAPVFNDQTITQLRNSGNLRLVGNIEISNHISDYWNGINRVTRIADRLENRVDMSAGSSVKIFNRKYVQRTNTRDSTQVILHIVDPAAQFLTKDKNFLAEHANSLGRITGAINSFFIPMMNLQGKEAIELIRLIKEEYDLE